MVRPDFAEASTGRRAFTTELAEVSPRTEKRIPIPFILMFPIPFVLSFGKLRSKRPPARRSFSGVGSKDTNIFLLISLSLSKHHFSSTVKSRLRMRRLRLYDPLRDLWSSYIL